MKAPLSFAVLALLPLMAVGTEQKTHCPLTLPAEALTVHAPPGWLGSAPSFIRLTDGGVMRGHPDGMGYLVPFRSKSAKGATTLTFVFEAGEEKWLWCSYGSRSPQLAKRLDDRATECTLIYAHTKQDGITDMYATCSGSTDSISSAAGVMSPPARPAARP
jgi:hypothetical protein